MDAVEKIFTEFRNYARQVEGSSGYSVKQANKATQAQQTYYSMRSNYKAITKAINDGEPYERLRKIIEGAL